MMMVFRLACKRKCESVAYRLCGSTWLRGPAWVPFILLLLMSLNSTHASPQITLISPSTDLWTESNNVEFDVNIADPSPAYGFINWEDSLVGWWRAEGNANDESKSGNHGTFVGNATTVSDGKFGQAFSFDGDGDSINIGDFPEFDFHKTDSFTISAWVKLNNVVNDQTIFYKYPPGWFLRYRGTQSRWEWYIYDGNWRTTLEDTVPIVGQWYHVIGVYDANKQNLSFYRDGILRASSSYSDIGDFSTTEVLQIGRLTNGSIDEVMILNRALSSGEIKSLYDATAQNLVTSFNDLDEIKQYNYEVYAVNAAADKTSILRNITVDTPNSPPVVTLDAPLSPTRSNSTTQQFTTSAVDTNADTTLASVTLYWDYGGAFRAEETISLSGDSDTAVFTKTDLTEGTITWNCYVTDSNGNSAFAANNHTLIIGRTEYYVAPYGDDTNPGTIDQPFKTIQRFADIALPGDTCYIRQGTYRETVTPLNSGNALAPITYKAYPAETVAISGADLLTGSWTQHQGSIYNTTMDWDLGLGNNQIFVDGKAMMEARWPNADDVTLPSFLDIDSGTIEGTTVTINDADLTQTSGYWDGAIVHATWSPRYQAITGEVSSSSPGSLEINLHTLPYGNPNSLGIYYIASAHNALDKENEWFYDNTTSTLYLWAPDSINPTSYTVEAKKRDIAFNLNGKSYVNLEGLDIFASTIITDEQSSYVTIDNLNASYVTHYTLIDGGGMASGAKGIRDTGIILSGHDNIIRNSEIAYSAGNGVSLIGNNNTVHNCEIYNVNYVVTGCAAVHTGSKRTQNNKITYNKLYNAGGCIVVHDDAENLKILYNEMYNNRYGDEPTDLGATYCINTDGKGSEIAYNRIHDIQGIGIYFDWTNYNFNVHHNVIWNIVDPMVRIGIHFNNPSINNKVYHNTIVDGLISAGVISTMAGTEIKNNICLRTGNPIAWPGVVIENNIQTDSGIDPLFVDIDNADFHLLAGSPLIDAGVDVGFTEDFEGNPVPQGPAPDIGAYEYVLDPDNHTPVLQAIGNKSVDENVLLTFTVTATDEDAGDTISYSAQNLPSGATFSSQTFSWTPNYDQAGSYQVTFRATDGKTRDSETITITVNNANRAPVLGPIANQSVNETTLLSFSVSATDADGDTITYSISGLPAGAVFAGQTFTWTPSYDQAGTHSVTFTADDGQAQDSETITITVINVNRAPVLTAIGNRTAYADALLTFTIDATDPDGDAITYSTGTLPSGATFTDRDFDWTPSQSQVGSYDVTFIASDGQLQDSETVTLTVDVDSLAPTVTNLSPTDESIQVPLNNLITLNVTDAGIGVEAKSVKIKVRVNDNPNNYTVYFGDTGHYTSSEGDCRRLGTKADYRFVYQSTSEMFYYDQTVTITVNATDLAGNVMDEYSYSFATEMHSFGQNEQVNSGLDNNDKPVTVCDSSGNIWTAWHAGAVGNRDIYVSKLAAGEENFSGTVQLTSNATDQFNPAFALDSNDKLYVVWQDNREGDWDIYVSTSVDGISWSTETRVNDPNEGNQVNPAIVIDSQNYAHVVWQDDLTGNQDIFIATSSDGFATPTVSQQITFDNFDQVEPAVAADSANTIYVVWTDGRNGSNNIYGAASNNPWTNVAIVSNVNNQSSPAIAAESAGSILHLLWVDDTSGDNDIYYASSDGLPGSPLTGSSIIDDSSGADQLDPTIAVTGSTDNNLKVFACWQDWRNTDIDLYFAELSAGSGTNVFVDEGGSNAYQGEPVIGIDEYSHPYLIWADNRSTNTDIYYTGSTFIEPVALASELVTTSASSSTTVGTDPQAITTVDDVSIVVPAGACSYDVAITVTKIANPLAFAAPCLGGYDFGPSGIQFSQPVTITIPYAFSSSDGSVTPYWLNSLTGALSQQGITNIQDITISSSLHALSFKTTHFTAFYLLVGGGGAAAIIGGGGGGGGCSVSASGEGNIVEYILPYIVLAVVMAILKVRDTRRRKARNMTTGKC